jgi:hypothetical protein
MRAYFVLRHTSVVVGAATKVVSVTPTATDIVFRFPAPFALILHTRS